MNTFETIKNQISSRFKLMSIELTENQYSQIYKYYKGLVEWNQIMNLTAITDEIEFAHKHIIDSVLLQEVIDLKTKESLIDIGTGAGLPGLVLKIVFPHLHVVLVDSLHKRISFLNEMIQLLDLEGIVAIQGRAEDMGKDNNYREKFDICVSRAVSQLPILSEYCVPFIKVEGHFVAYKSISTDEEIRESNYALSELNASIEGVIDIELMSNEVLRRFVIINKLESTPIKYPRKAGIPQKRPLIAKK
jgi:16S rRNA (guanine527-N7)-methyltransferase